MIDQRIVNSDELQAIGLELGKQSGELDIYSGLSSPFSSDVIVLSGKHIAQIEDFAASSIEQYGPNDHAGNKMPESTYVQQTHGRPTLLGRVDCTVDSATGEIVAYELEDSPSGIGITDTLHQAAGADGVADRILRHLTDQLGQLPMVIVSGTRNHGTDDAIAFGEDNYFFESGNNQPPDHLGDERLVIVKAVPGLPQSLHGYRHLQDRSVCTMESEGDKTYLERMGLLSRIRNMRELLEDEDSVLRSQVLKRAVGSMAMGVTIHLALPDREIYGRKGTVKSGQMRSEASRHISNDGHAYVQEFQGPIRVINPEQRGNMILRVFTLINPALNSNSLPVARAIGGCYVARPELVVHGASNAVGGAVLV